MSFCVTYSWNDTGSYPYSGDYLVHTHARAHTHTCTHARTHMHAHACTCTHFQSCLYNCIHNCIHYQYLRCLLSAPKGYCLYFQEWLSLLDVSVQWWIYATRVPCRLQWYNAGTWIEIHTVFSPILWL